MREQIVERDKGELRFEMRVLAQMAARVALFRTETLLHTVHIAERRQAGLEVQLRALRQERWLAIVVKLEQRRAALDLCLHHAWRRHFHHARRSKLVAETLHHCRTYMHHSRGSLATQHEMPVVRLNRRVRVLRNAVRNGIVAARRLADTYPVVDNELVVVRRSLALRQSLDRAVHLDRALERQRQGVVRLNELVLQHTLHVSCAVTQDKEHAVFLRAQAVHPSAHLHTHVAVVHTRTNLDALGRLRGHVQHHLFALLELLLVLLGTLRFLRGKFCGLLLLFDRHVVQLLRLFHARGRQGLVPLVLARQDRHVRSAGEHRAQRGRIRSSLGALSRLIMSLCLVHIHAWSVDVHGRCALHHRLHRGRKRTRSTPPVPCGRY